MAKKCKSAENVEFCQGIVAELDVLKKQCIVDKKTYSGYGQPDSCIEMKGRKKDFLQNSGRMTQNNFGLEVRRSRLEMMVLVKAQGRVLQATYPTACLRTR